MGSRVTGAKPRGGIRRSGGPEAPSDITVERLNHDVPRHLEPAAQIVPDRNAELIASLGETWKRIAAVAAAIAAGD